MGCSETPPRNRVKSCKIFPFWHQIGFPDSKTLILGAIECLNVTLGNISYGMSHDSKRVEHTK